MTAYYTKHSLLFNQEQDNMKNDEEAADLMSPRGVSDDAALKVFQGQIEISSPPYSREASTEAFLDSVSTFKSDAIQSRISDLSDIIETISLNDKIRKSHESSSNTERLGEDYVERCGGSHGFLPEPQSYSLCHHRIDTAQNMPKDRDGAESSHQKMESEKVGEAKKGITFCDFKTKRAGKIRDDKSWRRGGRKKGEGILRGTSGSTRIQ